MLRSLVGSEMCIRDRVYFVGVVDLVDLVFNLQGNARYVRHGHSSKIPLTRRSCCCRLSLYNCCRRMLTEFAYFCSRCDHTISLWAQSDHYGHFCKDTRYTIQQRTRKNRPMRFLFGRNFGQTEKSTNHTLSVRSCQNVERRHTLTRARALCSVLHNKCSSSPCPALADLDQN